MRKLTCAHQKCFTTVEAGKESNISPVSRLSNIEKKLKRLQEPTYYKRNSLLHYSLLFSGLCTKFYAKITLHFEFRTEKGLDYQIEQCYKVIIANVVVETESRY